MREPEQKLEDFKVGLAELMARNGILAIYPETEAGEIPYTEEVGKTVRLGVMVADGPGEPDQRLALTEVGNDYISL